MGKFFKILLFFFISIVEIFSQKYIAYWSFDDSTAKDFSGNAYHGTIMNSPKPVLGVNGKGTAFYFTGRGINDTIGDHILLPFIDFNSLKEFSVSFWCKWESSSMPHGDVLIFFGDWDRGWLGISNHYNHINPPDNTWLNFTTGSILHSNQIEIPFNPIKDKNKWFFYCMTHSNGITKAYINGVKVGEKAQQINIYGKFAGINRSFWGDGSITSARITQTIDEVKIWQTALTDEEIKEEYDGCGNNFRLITENNNFIIDLGNVYPEELYENSFKIQNISQDNITIKKFHFIKNQDFSLSASSIPTGFNSIEIKDIKYYFLCSKLGLITDTLLIDDNCKTFKIIFKANCTPFQYFSDSRCNTNITFSLSKPGAINSSIQTEIIKLAASREIILHYIIKKPEEKMIPYRLTYKIFNSIGMEMNSGIITDENYEGFFPINLTNFPIGIYFILISDGQDTISQKFVY